MNGLRRVCKGIAAALLLGAAMIATTTATAQIRIVDRAKIDSMANPPLAAEAAVMKFERTAADTGAMTDEDSPRTFEYRFRNLGAEPLVVTRISTTCGCTTAEAKPRIVPAGGEGCIEVRYNPKGHVGRFMRRVFVYTQISEERPTAILTLNATVTAGSGPSSEYPFTIGALYLRRNSVHFEAERSAEECIEIFNGSDKPLTIGCKTEAVPPCIAFRCEPQTIEPQTKAELTICYDASKMLAGRRSLTVPLMLTGTGQSGLQSTIRITIGEERPKE